MNSHNFENLEVWKRSCRLAVNVCAATHHSKLFALRDQIQKSAISIPSNIAEGAEKPTSPDFLRFLGYSKGSCGELKTQLMIYQATNNKLNIKLPSDIPDLIKETQEIAKMLQGLYNRLNANETT